MARRPINPGKRIWVKMTKAEFRMVGLDERFLSHSPEGDGYIVAGTVVRALPGDVVRVAIGDNVLRFPWDRIAST